MKIYAVDPDKYFKFITKTQNDLYETINPEKKLTNMYKYNIIEFLLHHKLGFIEMKPVSGVPTFIIQRENSFINTHIEYMGYTFDIGPSKRHQIESSILKIKEFILDNGVIVNDIKNINLENHE